MSVSTDPVERFVDAGLALAVAVLVVTAAECAATLGLIAQRFADTVFALAVALAITGLFGWTRRFTVALLALAAVAGVVAVALDCGTVAEGLR
ncbi:MAG: hypothetical protein OXN93_11430 [bacterium]|nr:hypothetical protein [bacterium]